MIFDINDVTLVPIPPSKAKDHGNDILDVLTTNRQCVNRLVILWNMERLYRYYNVKIEHKYVMVQVSVFPDDKYIIMFNDPETINRYKALGFKVASNGKKWINVGEKIISIDANIIWKQIIANWDRPIFEKQIDLPD